MKYLHNRENFINNRLNEAFSAAHTGGPGANNVNWGDSLVGRLINSFRRKVGIGVNVVRINQCIKQLKRQFDDILYYSEAAGLTEEQIKRVGDILLNEIITTIDVAIQQKKNIGFSGEEELEADSGSKTETPIKDEVYLKEVKEIVESGIGAIKSYRKSIKIENSDSVISSLEELRDKIKEMESDFVKTPTKEVEKEKEVKSFEVNKYYIYKTGQGKFTIFNMAEVGDNNKGYQWNPTNLKWGNMLQTMLKPENIEKEISIINGKLNPEDLKGYFKNTNIPVFSKPKTPPTQVKSTEKEPTLKSEGVLYRYMDFITENEDVNKGATMSNTEGDKKVTIETQQVLLKDYWINLWNKNLVKIVKTGEQIEKLSKEVTNIKSKSDLKGGIIIQGGLDPIISVLKVFNRAYKLHTTQVIPSGRTGGQVSNRTFREYTSFGGGTPENAGSSGGPYRNNKVFDIWESAVLDIIADRKYQPIFDKKTGLQVGDKVKDGVGPIFRKMITDLLDGESLYREKGGYSSSNGGAQKAFLDKYFGDVEGVKEIKAGNLSISGDPDEIVDNANLSSGIKTIKLEFDNSKPDVEDPRGIMFVVKNEKSTSDEEDISETLYFYVDGGDGKDSVSLKYSKNFGNFRDMLREIKSDKKYDLTELPVSKGKVYSSKMTWVDLQKLWNKTPMEIKGVDPKNSESVSADIKNKCKPKEINWLFKTEDDKKTLFKMPKKEDNPKSEETK